MGDWSGGAKYLKRTYVVGGLAKSVQKRTEGGGGRKMIKSELTYFLDDPINKVLYLFLRVSVFRGVTILYTLF